MNLTIYDRIISVDLILIFISVGAPDSAHFQADEMSSYRNLVPH